jgi:hypothetical protein
MLFSDESEIVDDGDGSPSVADRVALVIGLALIVFGMVLAIINLPSWGPR